MNKARFACVFVTALVLLFALVLPPGVAASSTGRGGTDASGFGHPPSGQIPIFYDDHHVYAKPDVLRRDRVLAALIENGQILVPLRSMFEQMGARVSFDPASKTVTATKGGSQVQLTLGRARVKINGEMRPLDVPPEMYRGTLVVPVRVISEALGAYVEWLPSRRIVIVRFFPPTPPPVAIPTATPAPVPVVIPTATPAPPMVRLYTGFIQGALTVGGKDYNEFGNGKYCRNGSFVASGAFKLDPHWALKIDSRQDRYVTASNGTDEFGNQLTVFSTIDGGTASTPVFLASQNTIDVRAEYRLGEPNWYAGIGLIRASNNYGYPKLGGLGLGVEKLPDFVGSISLYGSAFYYPSASGDYTVSDGASTNFRRTYQQEYSILTYDVGATWRFSPGAPVYAYGGFAGDRYGKKQNAPIDQTHSGLYVGLGLNL